MTNIFENDLTRKVKNRVEKDFLMSMFRTSQSSGKKLDIALIMELDETLSLDQNKKADHLKSVFTKISDN